MGLGQSVRLASVRCFTLPSRRKDSRRIIHGGELRLATVSMYMAIKAAQIGIKIKIKVHIYMATYLCQKTRESSIEAIQRTIARSKFSLDSWNSARAGAGHPCDQPVPGDTAPTARRRNPVSATHSRLPPIASVIQATSLHAVSEHNRTEGRAEAG